LPDGNVRCRFLASPLDITLRALFLPGVTGGHFGIRKWREAIGKEYGEAEKAVILVFEE